VQLLKEIDFVTQRMPILLPPAHRSVAATQWDARGQTRSGVNLTSWVGTEINRALKDAKAHDLGVKDVVKNFNYGDDSVLITDSDGAVTKWADTPNYAGFNETIAPDATYLMRRLPSGHTYLGRMIFASINREAHLEPRDPLAAAAAWATRDALLNGHPLRPVFKRVLNSWRLLERWRIALTILNSGTPAIALNQRTAEFSLAFQRDRDVENAMQSLTTLGSDGARDQVRDLLITSRAQMQWGDFSHLVSEMPRSEARLYIRDHSYVVTRQRRIAS
jgi:hypothetical protein